MLKLKKYCLAALVAPLMLAGCSEFPGETDTDPPYVPEPPVSPDNICDNVRYKFEKGLALKFFSVQDENSYVAFFSDSSYILFDKNVYHVSDTDPLAWPSVKLDSGNVWTVDGKAAGTLTAGDADNDIVAVIYDKEGLYIRCTNGRIYYFHDDLRDIGCFRFEKSVNPQLSSDIICSVEGSTVTAFVPRGLDMSQLVATFGYRGSEFRQGSVKLVSSISPIDYSESPRLVLRGFVGGSKDIYIDIANIPSIPVVRIDVEGGKSITTRSVYVNAMLTIEDPEKLYSEETRIEIPTEIKGRGNSTWGMPKKPYKLKLLKKRRLMGMSENKHWVLLANYSDKTLMRNEVVFEMSRILGMRWTPLLRHVEVYLNGAYQGVYMLAEHTQVAPERVDIQIVGPDDNSGDAITGGYLLELDERNGQPRRFSTSRGLPVNFVDPEQPTTEQFNYIRNYIQTAENILYNNDVFKDPNVGYAAYIDLTSFAHNYILQELTKNVDGGMRLSTFFYKERGGKLAQSHVWDFDLTLGNCDYINSSTQGYLTRNSKWHTQLVKDPAFIAVVKEEWTKLYSQLYRVFMLIENNRVLLDEAQKRNFQTWRILNTYVWPNVKVTGSYKGEVDYMVEFLTGRAEWLNEEISKW